MNKSKVNNYENKPTFFHFFVFAVIIGIPAVNASTQLINVSDEIGDVNHSDIDIIRVTINKYKIEILYNANSSNAIGMNDR